MEGLFSEFYGIYFIQTKETFVFAAPRTMNCAKTVTMAPRRCNTRLDVWQSGGDHSIPRASFALASDIALFLLNLPNFFNSKHDAVVACSRGF